MFSNVVVKSVSSCGVCVCARVLACVCVCVCKGEETVRENT